MTTRHFPATAAQSRRRMTAAPEVLNKVPDDPTTEVDEPTAPQEPVAVERFFLPDRNFMLMRADVGPLLRSRRDYLARHGLRPASAEAGKSVRRFFQAFLLWSSYLPNGTTTAWSILLPDQEWRLFLGAAGPEGQCVLRWSPTESEHRNMDPVFDCQTQRPGQLLQRSVFQPSSGDASAVVDEFFETSQQGSGFLFWNGDRTDAQVLIALADWDPEWLESLRGRGRSQLVDETEMGPLRRIGEPARWTYGCGCDSQRLGQAVMAAAGGDVQAIFGVEAFALVECPRCGREVEIRRP